LYSTPHFEQGAAVRTEWSSVTAYQGIASAEACGDNL